MKSVTILVLGILLVSSAVWAETMVKKEFTITLPTGWSELPKRYLDNIRAERKGTPYSESIPFCDYCFFESTEGTSSESGQSVTGPSARIYVCTDKTYTQAELHALPSLDYRGYKNDANPLHEVFSTDSEGKKIYDKSSRTIWMRCVDVNYSDQYSTSTLLSVIPMARGHLMIEFKCHPTEYQRYEPIFYNIATSVTLAPSLSRNTAEMPYSSIGIFAKLSLPAPELIGQILAVVVAALIGAIFVRIACKRIAKFKPPYGMAYKAAFLGYLSPVLVGLVVDFVLGALGQSLTGPSTVLLIIFVLFVQAALYSKMIKHPETGAIGFGKACQVIIVQWILGLLLMATTLSVLAVIIWYWHDITQLFFHN
jgi:hypothetical protein